MKRALLLLSAGSGISDRHVKAELAGRAAPLRQRAGDAGVELRLGVQIPDDPLAEAAGATGREIAPVRAVIQVTGTATTSDDLLISVLEGFGRWFGGVFEQQESTVALGTVRPITTGSTGPVLLVLGTRRLPSLSPEQFRHHWEKVHAPLGLRMMPAGAADRIGYHQLHVDREASARAADAASVARADLDGVLQVFCAAAADFLDFNADPAYAAAIYEDERKFAEASGMRGGFVSLA